MRTYEQIKTENPLRTDVLAARRVGDSVEWLRCSKIDDVPQDPEWVFPTEIGDLKTIYQGKLEGTALKVREWVVQEYRKILVRQPVFTTDPVNTFWAGLRKYLKCENSHGPIPRVRRQEEFERPTGEDLHRSKPKPSKSGVSAPFVLKKGGATSFTLTYRPSVIESTDRKILSYRPMERRIVEVLLAEFRRSGETHWTREQLYELLQADPIMNAISRTSPWQSFCGVRATLVRDQILTAYDCDGRIMASHFKLRART